LHAHGDSTGREIARALYQKASSLPNVRFQSYAAITDLLLDDGAVCGAVVYDEVARERHSIFARAVLLATGGLGRVYLETTNPDVATGDGVAMAWRAGAEISDIEFVQFHPTALHVEGAPRFLLSEALRGEGAHLINICGDRFMHRYHRLEELAPRDVVSRAIVAEMHATGETHVFLDLTHRGGDFIRSRFPRIYETCLRYGIDLGTQPAPVHPAAHYAMGGIRTDLDGRASLPGLYSAGEAACTGVHGANRLASNSLLEGVVFGVRAGRTMRESTAHRSQPVPIPLPEPLFPCTTEVQIRRLAWQKCGIIRSGERLEEAREELEAGRREPNPQAGLAEFCLRNIHDVALLIARCALARQESRGAHFRTDYPDKQPAFEKHSVVIGRNEVRFQ
jgi:L-aspartate oxidase